MKKISALHSSHLPREQTKGSECVAIINTILPLNLKVVGIKYQDLFPKPFNKKVAPCGNSRLLSPTSVNSSVSS